MDARLLGLACLFSSAIVTLQPSTIDAATFRTPNFIVHAPSASIAEQVGRTAEKYRKLLAIEWLGKTMPQWYKPCSVKVRVGQIGAGGATTFSFDRGHVFGWDMRVQGTLERILDSVIPHEVSHTVFATHFRRPLPRWADEGAATLVEHESEKRVQRLRLQQVLNTSARIPLRKLISMKQYPREMQQVLVLYAEGYSLADYLVQNAGKKVYLQFLDDAHRIGWDRAIQRHYHVKSVELLEKHWNKWVIAGSPSLNVPEDTQLASTPRSRTRGNAIIRSQSPDAAAAPRRFEQPVYDGGESKLVAPDPKGSRRHKTAALATAERDSVWARNENAAAARAAGRRDTRNAGWVPVIRRPLRRTAANQDDVRPTSENVSPFSPVTGRQNRRSISEERNSPRGFSPRWSEFPHQRTANDRSF